MSSPLKIDQRSVDGVHIFILSGHLVAMEGTIALRDAVRSAVAAGARACLIDLEDVSYVDSAGVGMLVAVFRHVTGRGGQLKLVHPSLCARRVLGITHLTSVFDVFDSQAEALHNLGATAATRHR
jgi:anti-sigma B factor antagonist